MILVATNANTTNIPPCSPMESPSQTNPWGNTAPRHHLCKDTDYEQNQSKRIHHLRCHPFDDGAPVAAPVLRKQASDNDYENAAHTEPFHLEHFKDDEKHDTDYDEQDKRQYGKKAPSSEFQTFLFLIFHKLFTLLFL